jgi:glycerol uptake facilitator-like aquaporin
MSPSSLFSTFKEDAHAALLEFVGTTFFLLFGLGGIQAAAEASDGPSGSNIEKVLYISTCMGLSLLVSAWLFFRVTGGLFNPNISLALLLVGIIGPVKFVLYCVAQMLGAIAASGLVLALTPGPLAVKSVRVCCTDASEADCDYLQYCTPTKHQFGSRRIHRNVHYDSTSHCGLDVSRREASRDTLRTGSSLICVER